MSTRILTVIGILSLTALVSCGPKDIGQGSSGDDEYADSGAPDPREEMRYPAGFWRVVVCQFGCHGAVPHGRLGRGFYAAADLVTAAKESS